MSEWFKSIIIPMTAALLGAGATIWAAHWGASISGLSNAQFQREFGKKYIGYQIDSNVVLETDEFGIKKIVIDDLLVKDLYSRTIVIQNQTDENLKDIDLCFWFDEKKTNNFRIIGSSYYLSSPHPPVPLNSEKDQQGCDHRVKFPILKIKDKLTFTFLTNQSGKLNFTTRSGEIINQFLLADLNEQPTNSNINSNIILFTLAPMSIIVVIIVVLYMVRKNPDIKFQKTIIYAAYLLGINGFFEEANRVRNSDMNISIASLSDELTEKWLGSNDVSIMERGVKCLEAFLKNLDLGNFPKATIKYNLIRISNAINPSIDIKEDLKKVRRMDNDLVEKRISYDEELLKKQ